MRIHASLLVIALIVSTGVIAAQETGELDDLVADIVRMLNEEVDTGLVADWLEQSGRKPGRLGPDEMIALKKAGAEPDLVRRLMELSRIDPQHRAPVRPDPRSPVPAPVTAPASSVSMVDFSVRYDPTMVEYQETPWDLFVYMDGKPLVSSSGWSSHTPMHRDQIEFEIPLPPGRHVIHVFQEKHTLKSRRKGTWRHEAKVHTAPMILDIETGHQFRVEISVREKGSTLLGRPMTPVEMNVLRDGATISRFAGSEASSHGWRYLCDEVETEFPVEKRNSKAARIMLADCVRWSDLWSELEGIPSREEVRDQLEALDWSPVPATTR